MVRIIPISPISSVTHLFNCFVNFLSRLLVTVDGFVKSVLLESMVCLAGIAMRGVQAAVVHDTAPQSNRIKL